MWQPPLEVVAEAIPHIVWLADASGSTDYVNERGTKYTGLPRSANYGWEWVKLVHTDDAERARLGWEHATRTATPFELSYRIRRSDGAYRWHLFRALPVRGPTGEIAKWIGTADDLTDPVRGLPDHARAGRQTAELRAMLGVVQEAPAERVGGPAAGSTGVPDHRLPAGGLSPRELAVARLVAGGYTNSEIADLLGFSLRTIEASRARLRVVLGARTRADLVRFARTTGLPG